MTNSNKERFVTFKSSDTREVIADKLKLQFRNEVKHQLRIARKHLTPFPKLVKLNSIQFTFHTADHIERSRGGRVSGKPVLRFALAHLIGQIQIDADKIKFHEYALIENSDRIGSFNGSIEKYIAALTAHELAHCLQYSSISNMTVNCRKFGHTRTELRKPHGDGWRFIYGILRKYAVNDLD